MGKDSFILYKSLCKSILKMSDKQLGRFFRSVIKYQLGEVVAVEEDIEIVFEIFKNQFGEVVVSNDCSSQHDRKTTLYKDWRKSVFARDNYTCVICGQHGGELNAHHIKPFAKYDELRFDVSNGITLCKRCHKEIHKKR